jgi:hypothetical protein
MNPHVNAITNRSILRPPQRISLEILARISVINQATYRFFFIEYFRYY